jgi:hypothetical protein
MKRRAILAALLLTFALAAPQGAPQLRAEQAAPNAQPLQDTAAAVALPGAPLETARVPLCAACGAPPSLPSSHVSEAAIATASPETATPLSGAIGTALMAGLISWAEPELGPDYLATRFPIGTLVEICAVECIVRVTTDFGPSAAIDPPRIADLSVLDWEDISGLDRSRGLVRGTIETVGPRVTTPPTDTTRSEP